MSRGPAIKINEHGYVIACDCLRGSMIRKLVDRGHLIKRGRQTPAIITIGNYRKIVSEYFEALPVVILDHAGQEDSRGMAAEIARKIAQSQAGLARGSGKRQPFGYVLRHLSRI